MGNGTLSSGLLQGQMEIGSEIQKLNIQIPDSKINLIGFPSQSLTYSGELKVAASSKEGAALTLQEHWRVQVVRDTLEMKLESFKSGYLDLQVPENLAVNVTTKNGAVHVENIGADVIVNTSNGKITADDIQANLSANTSNGAITVSNIGGELVAATSNGAITLSNIAGTIQANTSNGSMNATSAVNGA